MVQSQRKTLGVITSRKEKVNDKLIEISTPAGQTPAFKYGPNEGVDLFNGVLRKKSLNLCLKFKTLGWEEEWDSLVMMMKKLIEISFLKWVSNLLVVECPRLAHASDASFGSLLTFLEASKVEGRFKSH